MTKVIALETFTYKDNTVSMSKGQIAEIDDTIATELIADGYVEEYTQGGGSGGVMRVTFTYNDGTYTADKTMVELLTAFTNGQMIIGIGDNADVYYVSGVSFDAGYEFISLSNIGNDGELVHQKMMVVTASGVESRYI